MKNTYLSNEEKYKYLNKINKFYKYDSDIIKFFMNKNIKIFEDGSNNKKQKLTKSEIESLFILSKKTIKFMDDFSIDYWLDGGSLLGAMRNGKMIKWDDDIDLAIVEDQYIKLIEIIKKIGIKEDKHYIFKKYDIKFRLVYSKDAVSNSLKEWLIRAEHLTNNNKILFIDLISYIKNNKNQYVTNNIYFNKTYIYNISDIYPLRKIKLENQYFKCVNNPLPYLNKGYWFWYHLGRVTHTHFNNNTNIDKNSYFKLNLNEKILEHIQKIVK